MSTPQVSKATQRAELSPARQELLLYFQTIAFGRLEGVHVRDGQPHFDPPPLVLQTMKLNKARGPRPELSLSDYLLREEVIELFEQLDRIGDGLIQKIEIGFGLPLLMVVQRPPRAR